MPEIKRPKRGPSTHVLSKSGTVEYTERMPGTMEDAQDARKMVDVELPRKQPVYLTVHLTWEVQTVQMTHNVKIKLSKEQQIKLSKEQQITLSKEEQAHSQVGGVNQWVSQKRQ